MQRKTTRQTIIEHHNAEQLKKAKEGRYPFEVYVALLNMIIAASFLFDCNEFLSNTSAFKHKIKMLVKQLNPELIKIIDDDLGLLIGTDANARVLFNLQDGFKNYVEQLHLYKMTTHTPAQIAGLGELIQKFHQMPEWILHHNGIKIVETEKPLSNGK